tara:strand:- start:787 stop:930 length:144 start_codon:yes stop_codon:yes gene_type:complete
MMSQHSLLVTKEVVRKEESRKVKEKLQDERPQGENLEYFTEWINTIW